MGLVSLACILFKSLALFLSFLSAFPGPFSLVLAFEFSFTAPTQCDNLNISWSGGSGPFSLLITQPFTPPLNVSIPDTAFNSSSENGSFSTLLPFAEKTQFLLTMSDADGFGSGGTSDVLQVGSSVSGTSCDTAPQTPDFTFNAPDALAQCQSYSFTNFSGAAQPITVLGLIPLGQPFFFHSYAGASQSSLVVEQMPLINGTRVVFVMTDAKGREGGSTSLLTVSQSVDNSCINATTPHSTAEASTQTSTPSAAPTSPTSSGVKTGEIAGTVIGGVGLIGFFALALAYFLRRRARGKGGGRDSLHPGIVYVNNGGPSRVSRMSTLLNGRRQTMAPIDLIPPQARPNLVSSPYYPSSSTLPPRDEYEPSPYFLPSDASARDGHSDQNAPQSDPRYSYWSGGLYTERSGPRSASRSRSDGMPSLSPLSPGSDALPNPYIENTRHVRQPSAPYSATPGKGSFAGTVQSRPRLILHTDAEDVRSIDDSEPVVELPPMYSDRRTSVITPPTDKQRTPSIDEDR